MTTPNHKIRLVMELRRSGVTDTRVLSAIERTPREAFCPPQFLDRAYEDTALPIAHGQTLSAPTVVGLMTQAIDVGARHKVLEVGTGSGYQASVLSLLCRRLYTIERHKPLLADAEARFRELRINNIVSLHGDGWAGWPTQAPFDRIIVTAAPDEVPVALVDQLAVGGLLVLPVGRDKREQRLLRLRKTGQGVHSEELAAVRFVPMVSGMPEDGAADGQMNSA
ncbi:MAG: protein-L-isoaspartate(D-aspartate) O-methyltransferase [Alphaproteobacteria bacterium]|nr:protein-L-isoaspartate(D-aspartate) O-methyltransferase [Alphaproteobacteria bacterium]